VTRRPRIIPDQGHAERKRLDGKAFECARAGCPAIRLRGMPWDRPCASECSRTPLVVAITTTQAEIHQGIYRGKTPEGT
jgi:hypothetical protein